MKTYIKRGNLVAKQTTHNFLGIYTNNKVKRVAEDRIYIGVYF